MSRKRTRARNRRARLKNVCIEFEKKRKNPEAFADFLRRLSESDLCVWAVARSATRDNPLDDTENAMIAQVVAPRLAGMTPGSVHLRHGLAK